MLKIKLNLNNSVTKESMSAFAAVDAIEDENTIEYASRLYATCKDIIYIAPEIVSCLTPNLEPIDKMSEYQAGAKLNAWWKQYKKNTGATCNWFSETVYSKNIVVTPMGFTVDKAPVPAHGGVPGLPPNRVAQRIAADALFIYTSYPTGEKASVNAAVNPVAANSIGFPVINLHSERISVEKGLRLGDTMYARDVITEKLASSKEGIALAASINNKLYSHSASKSGGDGPEELVNVYNSVRNILKLPELKSLKVYKRQNVSYSHSTLPNTIWSIHTASLTVRGVYRGRGNITCGYYRGDLPHHTIRTMDLVNDVMMSCVGFGVKTVELSDEPEATRILVANGYRVVNPRHGKIVCGATSPPGLYSGSSSSYVRFLEPALEAIISSGGQEPRLPARFKFPSELTLHHKKSKIFMVVRDYIRPDEVNQYPSICASDGICIRAACPMHNYKPVEYGVLMRRFSLAMMYRNSFFMTRLLYAPMDPFRDMFAPFTYPKLVAGQKFYELDTTVVTEIEDDDVSYYSITVPVATTDLSSYSGNAQNDKDEWEILKTTANCDHRWWSLTDLLADFGEMEELLGVLGVPLAVISFMVSKPERIWKAIWKFYKPDEWDQQAYFAEINARVTEAAQLQQQQQPAAAHVPSPLGGGVDDINNLLNGPDVQVSTAELRTDNNAKIK